MMFRLSEIRKVSVAYPVFPEEVAARVVKYMPLAVGFPEITPDVLQTSPGGSPMAEKMDPTVSQVIA
jgi:hypothetical protein